MVVGENCDGLLYVLNKMSIISLRLRYAGASLCGKITSYGIMG